MTPASDDLRFDDLRIVDLDTRKTSWSRVHESMRVVYLRLDREPPDMRWVRLFQEERESRINPRRCGLWIEQDYICFDCLLDEVEYSHLPDIQKSIDFANRRYRELLAVEASRFRHSAEEQAQEVLDLVSLRKRIRERVGTAAGDEVEAPPPAAPSAAAAPPVIEQRPPDLPPATEHDALLALSQAWRVEPAAASATADADGVDLELIRRREQLREQYRAARTPTTKESPDGAG